MAEIVVSTAPKPIEFGATGIDEIAQNVRTIAATIQGSVPLDRELGMTQQLLDQPLPIARARLSAALVDAIERWEPRVTVKKVELVRDEASAMEGGLTSLVTIKILKNRS